MPAETTDVLVLWAVSERHPRPHFIAAWSGALAEYWEDDVKQRRADAEEHHRRWGDAVDGPWRFFTTYERVPVPDVPDPELVECSTCEGCCVVTTDTENQDDPWGGHIEVECPRCKGAGEVPAFGRNGDGS